MKQDEAIARGGKTYLDQGYVILTDKMGSDQSIEAAARLSYGQGTRKTSDTRNLLRYLLRNYHTSPFEMAEVQFMMKIPIFVMRQLVRHRTANLNEYSGRYSEMVDEFYYPADSRIQAQSQTNKQGSGVELAQTAKKRVKDSIGEVYRAAYAEYQDILDEGASRELARIVLPVGGYTELYWKCDLNNFFKFLSLRLDPHAQSEIVELATIMCELAAPHFPISFEAFEDYWHQGTRLSREELNILKTVLYGQGEKLKEAVLNNGNLSNREIAEFLSKFN